MKKLLFFCLSFLYISNCFCQNTEDNSWIYKTNFEPVNDSITKVLIDVNTKNITDSANLIFTISTEFGKNDVLLRKEVYSGYIVNNADIFSTAFGFRINLGQYLIKPELPFIVDMVIEPKGQEQPYQQ